MPCSRWRDVREGKKAGSRVKPGMTGKGKGVWGRWPQPPEASSSASAQWDAAFDRGLVRFADDGRVLPLAGLCSLLPPPQAVEWGGLGWGVWSRVGVVVAGGRCPHPDPPHSMFAALTWGEGEELGPEAPAAPYR